MRAPVPCRPTKLRLEVETQRAPGGTDSPFAATQSAQPGSRHSKPASRKAASSPSASAACFTRSEPGTTQAVTCGATLRPRSTAAAARRSSMRELVQDPMKTQSTFVPAISCPGARPI